MQRAYGVVDWNVSSGPGWIRTDRYDVAAKADVAGNLTEAQVKPMLQALLAERFKLRLHQSSKFTTSKRSGKWRQIRPPAACPTTTPANHYGSLCLPLFRNSLD